MMVPTLIAFSLTILLFGFELSSRDGRNRSNRWSASTLVARRRIEHIRSDWSMRKNPLNKGVIMENTNGVGAVPLRLSPTGGIGHTLPYWFQNFEPLPPLRLWSWPSNSWSLVGSESGIPTPFLRAVFQVIAGGVLVFLVGIWIGGSWPLK